MNNCYKIIGIFTWKPPGIDQCTSSCTCSHRTKRRIFIIRIRNTIQVDYIANILVPIKNIIQHWRRTTPRERPCCDWFCRIPDVMLELRHSGHVMNPALNLQVSIVGKQLSPRYWLTFKLYNFDTSSHSVIRHRKRNITLTPQHRAVLAVVGDGPDASGGLD